MKLQRLRFAFGEKISPSSPLPSSPSSSSSSLTINFKRLRPLAPTKLTCTDATDNVTALDLRGFESPKPSKCTEVENQDASPSGGTRWNPTKDQIRVLEELYRSGMRTPNSLQIERITVELGKYGRIEGKNVFYWFQNHKARERQRQKRNAVLLAVDATSDPVLSLFSGAHVEREEAKWFDLGTSKRKCRSWEDVGLNADEGDGTLELFPLHPERAVEESSCKNKD